MELEQINAKGTAEVAEADKYATNAKETRALNNDIPVISKIRIGRTEFDITTPKDWSVSNKSHKAYIHGRTHYEDTRFYEDEEEIVKELENEAKLNYTHTFKNTYSSYSYETGELGGKIEDFWCPVSSWITPGKKYKITLNYPNSGTSYAVEWVLPEDPADSINETSECVLTEANGIKTALLFHYKRNLFELTGEEILEPSNSGNSYESKYNEVSISPVPVNKENPDITTYSFVKKLNAGFIPVDNKTITQNEEGLLQAGEIFDTPLLLSQDFGKYKAQDQIEATGKTLMQIFKEAFCENLQPKIIAYPKTSCYIYDANSPESELIYEVGSEPKLSWEVTFNPGKYSYGTKKKHDSNLYIKSVVLKCSDTDSYEFKDSNGDSVNTLTFNFGINNSGQTNSGDQTFSGDFKILVKQSTSLTISMEINYILDGDDHAITNMGDKPVPNDINSIWENYRATKTNIKLDGAYRWFWGYRTEGNDFDFSTLTELDRTTTDFMGSSLTGLPAEIVTEKAKQWFFAIPNNLDYEVSKLKYKGIPASTMVHQTTDPIIIKDAAGNSVEYKLFYVSNVVADKTTNTYEIECNKNIKEKE
jgi:hypothetical protein